jgi:hypothetical protein
MHRSLVTGFVLVVSAVALGCSHGGDGSDADANAGGSAAAVSAHANPITDFLCTAIPSSTKVDALKQTRLQVGMDLKANGEPTGEIVTGFEASLHATSALGFGAVHVRDSTSSGHAVSEYKITFGAEGIVQGSTGGTVTIPKAYTQLALESSKALNVATMTLTPSNDTVTYSCQKDTRKPDTTPDDTGPVFQGAAKDTVAKDSCAKTVAGDMEDELIGAIEDAGVDIPDSFVFTSITKTDTGYKAIVNGATVTAVVAAGCKVKSVDTSAARSLGE